MPDIELDVEHIKLSNARYNHCSHGIYSLEVEIVDTNKYKFTNGNKGSEVQRVSPIEYVHIKMDR